MLAWFLTREPFSEPEPTDPQDSINPFINARETA
jgi:hypothetical protein